MRQRPILSLSVVAIVLGTGDLVLAQPGTKIWEFRVDLPVRSSPAVVGGRVFFCGFDEKIYCLSAKTGKKIWEFKAADGLSASPTVSQGRVYVGSWDHTVYCLRAATGQKLWKFKTGSLVGSTVAVFRDKVYVGSNDKRLYCLRALTGEKIWEFKTAGEITCAPIVVGDRVFFGSFDKKFYCLDAQTGEKKWEFETGGKIITSPAIFRRCVVFRSNNGLLYSLNRDSGTKVWHFDTGKGSGSSPTIAGEHLLCGSPSGKLYCLRAVTGEKLWEFDTNEKLFSTPSVIGGKVYFGDLNDNIYCLRIKDKEIVWKYKSTGYVHSTPAVVGGRVFVSTSSNDTDEGKLICLDVGDPRADGWAMFGGFHGDWPTRPGTKWIYRDLSSKEPDLVVVLVRFEELDEVPCAVFEWSDGLRQSLNVDYDGVHIRYSNRAVSVSKSERTAIKGWLKDLSSEDPERRELATNELSRRWFAARQMIEQKLKGARDKDVLVRFDLIRRNGTRDHAPLGIAYPLKEGLRWKNMYGESAEVLSLDEVETGLGKRRAWKIKIDERVIWWSEEDHVPLAVQKGDTRWILSRQTTQ